MHAVKASAGLRHPTVIHGSAPSSSSRAAAVDETCVLSNLLLKHPDEIFTTYVRKQMKHLVIATYATSRSSFTASR
jgi:hypothetical protein